MTKKKLILIIPLSVILILTVSFFVYAGIYYHADAAAEEALVSDGKVQVTKTDYGWFFDGPSTENALIFYPGAKVEETAYAPLCHRLADEGLDVCLVKMPFRFAFFGVNKADGIIGRYSYAHWYIGGHSLGGAMAADYAAGNADKLDGVILLAAYPASKLDGRLKTVLIYGSEDKVLNAGRYEDNLKNTPDDRTEHIIQGGNHAQFGSYGEQKGDGTASITGKEQVDETVYVIIGTVLVK